MFSDVGNPRTHIVALAPHCHHDLMIHVRRVPVLSYSPHSPLRVEALQSQWSCRVAPPQHRAPT